MALRVVLVLRASKAVVYTWHFRDDEESVSERVAIRAVVPFS